MSKKIEKPAIHDLLFKEIFSNKKFAKELFSLLLTSKEMKLFNWGSLTEEKDNFKNKRADLIFSVQLKNSPSTKAFIFLLLEHKSQKDSLLPLQLLEYQTLLYSYSQRTKGRLLPIIPFVFYHGKKPWNKAVLFQDIFEKSLFSKEFNKCFGKNVLNFHIRVLDINAPGMEKKVQNLKSCLVLEVLRRTWDFPLSQSEINQLLSLLKGVPSKDQKQMLISVYDYCLKRGISRKSLEIAEQTALKTGVLRKGGVMTLLEYTKREERRKGIQQGMKKGKQEGIQQGMKKGIQGVVLKMLKNEMDLPLIQEVTGLSEEEICKLKNNKNTE